MKILRSMACLLFALFGLYLSGCMSGGGLGGITVNIIDFRPISASLMETQADVSLRFINENVVPIAISGGTYSLYLNGTYVGKAVSHEAIGLPQQSTATQTVRVFLENLALVKKLQGMQGANAIEYRLESVMRVDAGDTHYTIKNSSSGSLDLSAMRGE